MELRLFMLDTGDKTCSLVPIYAENEQAAWMEAWTLFARQDSVLPATARLIEFPHGFRVHYRHLPGKVTRAD